MIQNSNPGVRPPIPIQISTKHDTELGFSTRICSSSFDLFFRTEHKLCAIGAGKQNSSMRKASNFSLNEKIHTFNKASESKNISSYCCSYLLMSKIKMPHGKLVCAVVLDGALFLLCFQFSRISKCLWLSNVKPIN